MNAIRYFGVGRSPYSRSLLHPQLVKTRASLTLGSFGLLLSDATCSSCLMWSVWSLSGPHPTPPLCWPPVSQTSRTDTVCLPSTSVLFPCSFTFCYLVLVLYGLEIPYPCYQMVLSHMVNLRWLVLLGRLFLGRIIRYIYFNHPAPRFECVWWIPLRPWLPHSQAPHHR